jgi:asparagine synthase (glutamine-hydrolysing)
MCGIAGIWNYSQNIEADSLEKFILSLRHRGPDGQGVFIDNNDKLGLAHRRLAIMDLSDDAKQPMSYMSCRYWITFNGEIYNFIELKEELESCGYTFQSQSDTEVIMAAYDKWGVDCQKKFNGMWAFALWDTKKKEMFCSRDRFGIKPFYYIYKPGYFFAFASETIAFKHLDNFTREFDTKNITRVLNDAFCLEGYGETIFKQIFQILPGHHIKFSHKSGIIQDRWWSTCNQPDQDIPPEYEKQVSNFKELFFDSCSLRMRSDVPLGTALSGGVDSSSVYCVIYHLMKNGSAIKRMAPDWQKAFIGTFPNTRLDEAGYASEVIKYTGGKAEYIVPNYSDLIDRIKRDTIIGDYIYITPPVGNFIYLEMAKNGIKVSLDGHGVDEMLFGYPGLVFNAYTDAIHSGQKDFAEEIAGIFIGMHPEDMQKESIDQLNTIKLSGAFRKLMESGKKNLPLFLKKRINGLLIQIRVQQYQNWLRHTEFLSETADPDNTKQEGTSTYIHFHKTTLPTILRNFDRASMGSGVEIRMPFMDWRLVSFVFHLPIRSKLGDGFTKRILRDTMKDIMPESIRTRKTKIGLNAPMIEWFSHELREYILEEVNSKEFLESEIWNGPLIKEFVDIKMDTNSWTWDDCTRFWPYLNAHILMKGES